MTETARIVSLPYVDDAMYSRIARSMPLTRPGATGELWEQQARCLGSLALHGGVVAQLGCGDGKGLVSMLGPVVTGAERPLVLVPSKLQETFHKEFNKFDRLGFNLPRNIELRSHGYVSTHSRFLDEYKPDYMFVDEGHNYRRLESSRTERLLRYLNTRKTRARGGDLVFGVASGTLVASSILDCVHLTTHAVGSFAPLPRYAGTRHPVTNARQPLSRALQTFANTLDPDGRPSVHDWTAMRGFVGALLPHKLARFKACGAEERRRIVREAFSLRRRSAPGVIVSDAETCGVPLELYVHDGPGMSPQLRQLYAFANGGSDPLTGDPFTDPVEKWRALQQLSTGCYYRWDWTRVGRQSPDEQWLTVRSQWNRALAKERRERCGPDYDSEGLITIAVKANPLHRLRPAWDAWSPLENKYNIDDLREIVWLDPTYVAHVVAAAQADPSPAIVWYASDGVERALQRAGLPCYGAGTQPPDKAITCGLSMRCHGTGQNLQDRWATAYFAEFPPSGEQAEQVIARLHRPGQRAPVVRVHVWTHTPIFKANLAKAVSRAEFISWAQGRQRLTYASFLEA